MAASPSSVLTMGLGSWAGVELVPTLGYGIGAAAAVGIALQWDADHTRLLYDEDGTTDLEWTLDI